MTDPEDLLRRITADLQPLTERWALIGGLAVGARTEPRFTRDVDIVVSVLDDAEAEQLVYELRGAGYDIATTIEHDVSGQLATIRLALRGADPDAPYIDLLFSSSGIEPEIVDQADETDVFPGQRVRVASVGHLIALKLLARADHRPDDQSDLLKLVKDLDPRELTRAREAVSLIVERGYARERNLAADLENLLESTP